MSSVYENRSYEGSLVSREQYDYVLADASAAWDLCEQRRLQAAEYRERAHFAESLLMRTGLNGALFQEYSARYPMPTPQELPEVVK